MTALPQDEALDTTDKQRYKASRHVTQVSVAANVFLSVAQVIIGVLGHSQALVADGMHTLSDVITDFMVLFALKHGRKAADTEHPYGHGRIETAVTMILGATLFAVGVGIAVRAGLRLADPEPFVIPSVITLWVAVTTIFAKEGLYHYTMRTANRYGSNLLRANAWHHRSDAVSSLIVVIGIGGSLIGFGYFDAAAAIVVAFMVAKIGFGLARQALRELIDTGLESEHLDSIRKTILSVCGVQALHLLRTRRVGGRALVDVHIIVDDKLSVSEGHQISETVRAKLIDEIGPVADVMVHTDTEEDIRRPSCADLPLRDQVLKRLDRYFQGIPEAKHIERTTLHYRNGRIDVELLLPLSAVADMGAARKLRQRFAASVEADREIASLDVRFH